METWRQIAVLSACALGACAGGEGPLSHDFPAVEVGLGEERAELCQSWTLGNEESLFVTAVVAENDGAWHHSNWLFVPDHMFDGPDGTWPCAERGYHEAAAGAAGGAFFAQSTQARVEEQRFPAGAALRIPPRSRIVGGIHLLNTTGRTLRTGMRFRVETVPAEQVATRMQLMRFNIGGLDLAPHARTEHAMTCGIAETTRREAMDFRLYYALAHYHALGAAFRFEALGGPDGPVTIFETENAVGDVLGGTLDPPVDVTGATDLRVTCAWENPRDERVGYGIGDQEMCVMLAFTDSDWKLDAGDEALLETGEVGGVQTREHGCRVLGFLDPP